MEANRINTSKRRLAPKFDGHRSQGPRLRKKRRRLSYWEQHAKAWAPFVGKSR